jgi:hypothetical protein
MFEGLTDFLQRETCTAEWIGRMEIYAMMYLL